MPRKENPIEELEELRARIEVLELEVVILNSDIKNLKKVLKASRDWGIGSLGWPDRKLE